MDQEDAKGVVSTAPIPERGLDQVCGIWAGRGQIWQALAAVSDPEIDRQWTERQVRRRAARVLFTLLAPAAARLPRKERAWIDALPAESYRTFMESRSPGGRVDWVRTRQQGWPPKTFVIRRRERRPNSVLLTALAWVCAEVDTVLDAAPQPADAVEVEALERLQILGKLGKLHPIVSAAGIQRPRADDMRAIRASGSPWRQLADVANELRALEGQRVEELARTLLAPDPELRWRLFHLAVLGEVLSALADLGGSIQSSGPIGDGESSPRAAFSVEVGGKQWKVWFEAASIWRELEIEQPYRSVARAVKGDSRALGADVLLIDADATRALIIECKYSDRSATVGRGGYHQATTYLAEAQGRLVDAAVSVAVGPSGVVTETKLIPLVAGFVGFCPPEGIASLVEDAVAKTGAFASA